MKRMSDYIVVLGLIVLIGIFGMYSIGTGQNEVIKEIDKEFSTVEDIKMVTLMDDQIDISTGTENKSIHVKYDSDDINDLVNYLPNVEGLVIETTKDIKITDKMSKLEYVGLNADKKYDMSQLNSLSKLYMISINGNQLSDEDLNVLDNFEDLSGIAIFNYQGNSSEYENYIRSKHPNIAVSVTSDTDLSRADISA